MIQLAAMRTKKPVCSPFQPSHIYIVRKSCGYPPDGFHGYSEPEVSYVGAFTSVTEANKCVVGNFYDNNPWGLTREDEWEDVDRKEDRATGLIACLRTEDDEVWEVTAARVEFLSTWTGSRKSASKRGFSPAERSNDAWENEEEPPRKPAKAVYTVKKAGKKIKGAY